jgi:hypothetical protein
MQPITYQSKDFFVYALSFSALAAGTNATQNLTIQADSDFILQKLTYEADLAAAAQTDSGRIIPLCSVLIVDSGSGRQSMNIAAGLTTLFGTGQIPFILPQPKVFLAQSNISVTLANISAATTYNIRLSFIGVKGFR